MIPYSIIISIESMQIRGFLQQVWRVGECGGKSFCRQGTANIYRQAPINFLDECWWRNMAKMLDKGFPRQLWNIRIRADSEKFNNSVPIGSSNPIPVNRRNPIIPLKLPFKCNSFRRNICYEKVLIKLMGSSWPQQIRLVMKPEMCKKCVAANSM